MNNSSEYITIQGLGNVVDNVNQTRLNTYLKNILIQDINLENALTELEKAREFLGDPNHILGSMSTKHGEVAEVFEVTFGNADKIINGKDPVYTFEGVGRTAPEDYLKNNLPVQSKFVQNNLSVDAVVTHLDKYPEFVANGGTYCIPNDFYNKIDEWIKMPHEELMKLPVSEGGRIARNIVSRVHELESRTGKCYSELLHPAQLDYNEVQLYNASDTIRSKENYILEIDKQKREEYFKLSQASFKEGFKTAGISAVVSGTLSFACSLIGALKTNNKKISELTSDDWKEIFIQTGIGTLKGGISGAAIYVLTNVANISLPLSAGIISATLGIATEAIKLYKNQISFDDFMYNILGVATETAITAIGAVAGNIILPGIGGIIGSIVTATVLHLVKEYIFGGGYYKLVETAHYEKQFSDMYKPLVSAFEQACTQWAQISSDITNYLSPYIRGEIISINTNIQKTNNYIENI